MKGNHECSLTGRGSRIKTTVKECYECRSRMTDETLEKKIEPWRKVVGNHEWRTVEPVYNGPVLSGHPLLSGQFSKSRFCAHTNAIFVTCIRRPPLLSGCGHPLAVLCLSFFVIFTCIKRPPLNGN